MIEPGLSSIYDVNEAPLIGMNSARHPLAMPPTIWPLLQNVRLDDGTITARQPTVLVASGGLPVSQPWGVFSGLLDGNQIYLTAMTVGSQIAIYDSYDGINWTEATVSSGAYGSTRLSGGLQVTFQAVRDRPGSLDTVVIQNGTDSPRIYTRLPVNLVKVRIHASVTAPDWALTARPVPTLSTSFFAIANNAAKAIVNTNLVNISTTTGAGVQIQITTASVHGLLSGDFVAIAGATLNTATNGTWIVQVIDASNFKIFGISDALFATPVLGNGLASTTGTVATQTFMANGNNNVIQLALNKTAVNVSSVSEIVVPTIDITGSAHMIIAADSATLDIWSNLIISLKTTSISYIYPVLVARVPWTDPGFQNTPFTGGWQGEELLIYSLGDLDPSAKISISKLTAFWQGAIPTASVIANIHAIFFSGSIAQTPSYAVAYRNSGTKAQSPGRVMPVKIDVTANTLVSVAGATSTVVGTIPYLPYIGYNYSIPIQGPSVTDLALGIDTLDVYRRDTSSTNYYFVKAVPLGVWNDAAFLGTWCYKGALMTPGVASLSGGVLPAQMNFAHYLNTFADKFDFANLAPDDLYVSIPIGFAMTVANNRLVVGSGLSGSYPNVQTSEGNNAFRFRQLSDVNAATSYRSPSFFTLQGENIQAFATVASSALGSSIIYVFTQKAVYVMGGFDSIGLTGATLRFQMGTLSPFSVCQRKGYVYWLNEEGQVCRLDNVTPSYLQASPVFIGRKVIDDRTRSIPAARIPFVRAIAAYERFYLCYTPSGSAANTRALVWDEVTSGWIEDTFPVDAELIYTSGSSPNHNYVMTRSGVVYEHEKLLDTTPQVITITTPQLRPKPFTTQIFNRLALNADVSVGATVSIARTYFKTGQTEISTVSLSAKTGENRIYRFDNYLGQPVGKADQAVSLTLTGTLAPGTKIYSIGIEMAPRESALDVDTYAAPVPPSGAFYGLDFSDPVDTIYLAVV